MIPILDFSSQNFRPEEIWEFSVRELVDLASRQSQFVVMYNKQYHLSVLVISDLVVQLVESLKLSPNDSALDTGLLDLLQQGQVTVGENEPASRVAWLAVEYDIEVVIATNYNAIPTGLFIPSTVTEYLPQTVDELQQSSPHLKNTIGGLTQVADLPRAIMALESERQQFRSPRVTNQTIRTYKCPDHGKPHYIFRPTCSRHPGAEVK